MEEDQAHGLSRGVFYTDDNLCRRASVRKKEFDPGSEFLPRMGANEREGATEETEG